MLIVMRRPPSPVCGILLDVTKRPRAARAPAWGAHFVHDVFSDVLYVLLPVWAGEFGLTFAQVGFMRTVYSGGMALFQVPAGLLAERRGERRLLAAGAGGAAGGLPLPGGGGGGGA